MFEIVGLIATLVFLPRMLREARGLGRQPSAPRVSRTASELQRLNSWLWNVTPSAPDPEADRRDDQDSGAEDMYWSFQDGRQAREKRPQDGSNKEDMRCP